MIIKSNQIEKRKWGRVERKLPWRTWWEKKIRFEHKQTKLNPIKSMSEGEIKGEKKASVWSKKYVEKFKKKT
jgi:hypothetical protein